MYVYVSHVAFLPNYFAFFGVTKPIGFRSPLAHQQTVNTRPHLSFSIFSCLFMSIYISIRILLNMLFDLYSVLFNRYTDLIWAMHGINSWLK